MRIDIITVFPEMFRGFLGESILSRAVRAGKVFIRTVDLRDFARDQRRTVDDKPYSGGPGMLMRPDVWTEAIEAVRTPEARVVLTTPAGAPYTQRTAEDFSRAEHLVFLCGHYEGIDERVRRLVTDEVSMGDFVLTGGEIPVAAMVDSVVRLLPGVLGGGAVATARESFGPSTRARRSIVASPCRTCWWTATMARRRRGANGRRSTSPRVAAPI